MFTFALKYKRTYIKFNKHYIICNIFHCLKNLDMALAGLERQTNSRGFFEYNISDLEKIGKIFEINGIPAEEISFSENKLPNNNFTDSNDKTWIFYKYVNNNVILRFCYDKIIIDKIKICKYRKWHIATKLWEISSNEFETFKKDIEQAGYPCIEDIENSDRNQLTPKKRPLGEYLANKVHNAPSKNRKLTEKEQKRIESIPESLKRSHQVDFKAFQTASSSSEEEDEIESILKTL